MDPYSENRSIKAWAEDDRPREKLLSKGRGALSDAELIAILLGSGSRDLSAVELGKQILRGCGNQLSALARLQVGDLMKYRGVGEAKAVSIVAALELGRRRKREAVLDNPRITSSAQAYELLSDILTDLDHEEFWVILLSRSLKVKDRVCISRGGLSGTVVDQRLIFKPAIEKLASCIILCHNHPSGNLRPSQSDIDLTKKVVRTGATLDIPVNDHIIFSDDGYFSFSDEGMIGY